MKYVGVCYDSGAWGGDLTGHLVGEFPEGWRVATSHISSGEGWSKVDIQGHFDWRPEPGSDDTYEWLGRMGATEIEERFGWNGQAATQSEEPLVPPSKGA